MKIRVEQIDHVEMTVPNRFEAADWYQDVLGLEVLTEYLFWAKNPDGPLMIGPANGGTKLALFEGESLGSKRNIGFHLLAFRVSGKQFLAFCAMLNSLQLAWRDGQIVSVADIVDHQLSFSLYFCDPWGHELELTTYEHGLVRESLRN